MKNTISKSTVALGLTALLAGGLLANQAFAQGGGGSGGGGNSNSGSGSGDQIQDRDRTQDPSTHDGDEPIQDRDQDKLQEQDQDRDRVQDPTTHDGDESIQDRDQLRDRLRDQLEDPDQDRDQDRIRANDSTGLQELISASEEASDEIANGLGDVLGELERNRNRVEVSVMALIAAQNMLGQYGQQASETAQALHNTYRIMTEEEEQIRSRGFLRRLFFGGDRESANAIQEQLQQNEQRIERIRQYLNDCDCDEQVRNMLQEQVRNMEEEHTRLRDLAEAEASRWGLFSWRF